MRMITLTKFRVSLWMENRVKWTSIPTSPSRAGFSPMRPQHSFLPKILLTECSSQPLAIIWVVWINAYGKYYHCAWFYFLKGNKKGIERIYLKNKVYKCQIIVEIWTLPLFEKAEFWFSYKLSKYQRMMVQQRKNQFHVILWGFSKLASLYQGKSTLGVCYILYKGNSCKCFHHEGHFEPRGSLFTLSNGVISKGSGLCMSYRRVWSREGESSILVNTCIHVQVHTYKQKSGNLE